ncbi:MAG TPA: condensation domain-containing protein, partial [Pseudonocardiaceae bacterium]
MPAFDASPGGTLVDVLRGRAIATPTATAYEFVEDDGGERIISYAELDASARAVAAALGGERAAGQRALLLYPPGPNYIIGLLGCFYAGVVAVPMYLPTGQRALARVIAAAADAGAMLVLSDAKSAELTRSRYAELAALGSLTWLVTDELPDADWVPAGPGRDDLAFLQYTSGSTGKPKGVMVRHGNLMANSATISAALRIDEHTRGVSWLPPYHDMGLIGGLLQPLYAGFPCTLLTPTMFLRRPYRWLEAISRHRATVSAGPDFGYLECVRRISEQERAQLDLSTWRHALVGAEPVRPSTMAAFQEAFGPVGFRRESFHPCYGLAEATLFVTGGAVPAGGPRLLEVSRSALEQGTAVPGPGVVFTGCGRVQRDEIVELVAPDSGKPVAPGTVGEVLVSGDTVTGGYWDQPEETDRVFRARVDGYPDRVFLRTGDLGFQLEGELFITGRIKDLMVVRGRNHYPHDIEQTAERAHPLLQPARAAVFSVDDGTEERVVLVHEVVRGFTPADGPAVLGAVREAVAQAHGLALHEVILVRPGTIPRTTSGKIQHAATRLEWAAGRLVNLAEPDGDTPPVADTSEAARLVAGAVDLLPDKAMPYAPLVALGLDSLRAVRLSATLRERLDIDVPVDKLLGGMTLGQLDRIITDRAASPRPDRPQQTVIIPTEARASRAQQRMWLLDQLGAGNAYHVLGGVRLTGPVDPALLRECLTALVHRYPALRGCFRADADGALVIDVRPPRPLPLPIVDLTDLPSALRATRRDEVIAELGDAPFDLGTGPLLRAVLIKLDAGEWCLGVAAHHIIVDGWSLGVLMRQLGGWYRLRLIGEALPDEQVPLPDQSETGLADDGFWQHALAGAAPVDLPLDGAQPLEATWNGASLPFTLPAAQVARLTAYGAGRGATLFMTLLGAFATVLTRWTGQSDLVIGAPMAGRDRRVSADQVGLFVNTVPLRVDVSGAPSFGELLGRVRATCLAAYPHQNVPFDEIVRQADVIRSGGRAPLVRVALTLQNVPLTPWQAGDVHAEPFELPAPGAQFELALHLTEQRDGGITGHVSYAADLFGPDTVRRLLDALDLVLRAVPDFPALPVPDLPMITDAERERVVEVFSGAQVPPVADGLLHEPFERQADQNPDAVAVIAPDGTMTYGELEAAANRLARLLLARGVRPDQPVAVCLPRGR